MRKLIRIIAVILLIVGIGFFAYPIALRVVFNMQANQAIDQLEQLKTDEFQTDDSVTDELLITKLIANTVFKLNCTHN